MADFTLPPGHPSFEDPLAFVAHPYDRKSVPERLCKEAQLYFNRRERPAEYLFALVGGDLERAKGLAPREDQPYLAALLVLIEENAPPGAFGSPDKIAAYFADPTGERIPMGDLPKAAVLAALYNAATPVGLGAHDYQSDPVSEETARSWLDARGSRALGVSEPRIPRSTLLGSRHRGERC